MASNNQRKSKSRFGCCMPIGRKFRKDPDDVELRKNNESEQMALNSALTSTYHNVANEPVVGPSISTLDNRPGVDSQHCPTFTITSMDEDSEKPGGLNVKRDHSSTVTSFDEVVSRNSLTGSISSELDNLQIDNTLDHTSDEAFDDDEDNIPNTTENHFDSIPSDQGYIKANESDEKQGQRMSTISGVSLVSSGYGSLKDTKGFLPTEMVDIPFEDHQSTSSAEITETLPPQRQQQVQSAAQPAKSESKRGVQTESAPHEENIVASILRDIEEQLEKKHLQPKERANLAIQFGNFSARYMTSRGGKINITGTRVSLYVPPGALDVGDTPTLVYIYLHPARSSRRRSLNNNRRWLTPNVECGPHGLVFKKDVYLTMPHYAVNPSKWNFDGHQTKKQPDGESCSNSVSDGVVVSEYEVTMMLDHFCTHGCSGETSGGMGDDVRKWMKAAISFQKQDDQHVQITVQVCDIDNNVDAAVRLMTDSFPVNKSCGKVFVVVKALDKEWLLDEEPFKDISSDELWNSDPEVTFTAKLKDDNQQHAEEEPFVACIVDVFQHNNSHRGITYELQETDASLADGEDKMALDERNDIQMQFLLDEDDIAPPIDCEISNRAFRELCVQLENGHSCEKGWAQLAEAIGIEQYQYILRIENRAKTKGRSPAAIVLDLVFKNKETLDALKWLSNIFHKIDNSAAKDIVDREILDITSNKLVEGDNRGRRSSSEPGSDLPRRVSTSDDGYLSSADVAEAKPDINSRKFSLRTKLFISSIPERMSKMSKIRVLSFKKKEKSMGTDGKEVNADSPGHENVAYEEDKPDDNKHEHDGGASCSSMNVEVSRDQGSSLGSTDGNHKCQGLDIPDILVTSYEASEPQLETTSRTIDVNASKDDAEMLEVHECPPSPAAKEKRDRDSGISSISSGSRDSCMSWKSVISHDLTVCPIKEEF